MKSFSLMLLLALIMVNLPAISTANLLKAISTFTLSHVILVTQNLQLFLVTLWEWQKLVLRKVANVRKLKDCFKEKGYPEDTVNKETKSALESPSLGLLWLGRLLCYLPQKIFSSGSSSCHFSACSVALFMSSYYLEHCSFSPWYSRWVNWNCTKGFLLIVCTVMVQNYYSGKIVKLYIRERLCVERMHQKKTNAETLCKTWFVPFVTWLPSTMSNHDEKWVFYAHHIYIHIYTYIYIHIYIYIYKLWNERALSTRETCTLFQSFHRDT